MRMHVDVHSNLGKMFSAWRGLDKAMASALRSEAYRLNREVRSFAESHNWGPFAPITTAFRKGQGYGRWFSRYVRYYVDPVRLEAKIGILTKNDVDRAYARFKPISRGFALTAGRLQEGFVLQMTRRRQRRIAAALQKDYGPRRRARSTTTGAHYMRMWAKLNFGDWRRMIPRVGPHIVPARPIIPVIWEREESHISGNVARNALRKVMSGRYGSVI